MDGADGDAISQVDFYGGGTVGTESTAASVVPAAVHPTRWLLCAGHGGYAQEQVAWERWHRVGTRAPLELRAGPDSHLVTSWLIPKGRTPLLHVTT